MLNPQNYIIMTDEALELGNNLLWKIGCLEHLVKESDQLLMIDEIEECPKLPDLIDFLTPEAKGAIEAKLAEIKQIIIDDLTKQLEAVKREFEKL